MVGEGNIVDLCTETPPTAYNIVAGAGIQDGMAPMKTNGVLIRRIREVSLKEILSALAKVIQPSKI